MEFMGSYSSSEDDDSDKDNANDKKDRKSNSKSNSKTNNKSVEKTNSNTSQDDDKDVNNPSVPIACQWIVDESDDSSDDDDDNVDNSGRGNKGEMYSKEDVKTMLLMGKRDNTDNSDSAQLPSAKQIFDIEEEIFSTPSFLAGKSRAPTEIKSFVKSASAKKTNTTNAASKPAASASADNNILKRALDETNYQQLLKAAPSGGKIKQPQANNKGASHASQLDKETAKDRVKRQRLSGQAGIGSDFRTWRSDEEMRLRQQFDT
jgi:hypothetical protein